MPDRDARTHVGFTGTKGGMVNAQRKTLVEELLRIKMEAPNPVVAHHGGCVGADAQFHACCLGFGFEIVVHPPIKGIYRAVLVPHRNVTVLEPKPYLVRNQDIVDASNIGFAAPKDYAYPGTRNLRGQGTWSTWRKFCLADKLVITVFPDGSARHNAQVEGWPP